MTRPASDGGLATAPHPATAAGAARLDTVPSGHWQLDDVPRPVVGRYPWAADTTYDLRVIRLAASPLGAL